MLGLIFNPRCDLSIFYLRGCLRGGQQALEANRVEPAGSCHPRLDNLLAVRHFYETAYLLIALLRRLAGAPILMLIHDFADKGKLRWSGVDLLGKLVLILFIFGEAG